MYHSHDAICHHKEAYKKSCDCYEMTGKAGGHTCNIVPNFLRFPTKAQPAGQINGFSDSAIGDASTSEYPAAP